MSLMPSKQPNILPKEAEPFIRIESLEILRGLASLSVAWFHLTQTHPENWVRLSGKYGWIGVEIFFVVSGFVILLSIHQRYGLFGLRDFVPYMARRIIRLEPPYLAAIAMFIVLWELSSRAPGFAGGPPQYEWLQILAHLAYVIPLTPYDWLDPVYWTLAYEFVFYICAGVFFQVLGNRRDFPFLLITWLLMGAAFAELLPPRALMFVFGIAVFRRLCLRANLWVTVIVLASVTLTTAYIDSPLSALAGLTTGLTIWATVRVRFRGSIWRPFFALGTLSYSLYLVHGPIGARAMNLLGRVTPDTVWADLLISLVGLALSLVIAYAFSRWIEQPAIGLARRVGARLEERNADLRLTQS